MDSALRALEYRADYPLERASTYDLLGCIFSTNGDVDAARDHFKRALKLRLKHLIPNHPDIGVSYEQLAGLEYKASALIDAELNYEAAAKIFAHNYPSNHPTVLRIDKCLARVRQKFD